MDESMHQIEADLHEVMGRLKHNRYIPTAIIEGLTPTEGNVLMSIDRATIHTGKAPRPGHIGADTFLSASALSQVLKTLEERGLITRERVDDDNRGVAIVLTEAGERKAEVGRAFYRSELNAIEEYLGEDDLRALLSILRKVDAYFQDQVAQGKATSLGPRSEGGSPCA